MGWVILAIFVCAFAVLVSWGLGYRSGWNDASKGWRKGMSESLWLEHKRLVANALEQGKTVEWRSEDGFFTRFSEVIYHNPDDQIVVVNTDDGPVTVKYEQLAGVRLDGSGDMEVVS